MQTRVTIEKVGKKPFNWFEMIDRTDSAGDPHAWEVLQRLLISSEVTHLARYDGQVACVWGVVPPTLLSETARLWMINTDVIKEHQFIFIRYSQLVIEQLLKRYPIIAGTTDPENRAAIRWIQWLGGKYIQIPGQSLLSFEIRRKE